MAAAALEQKDDDSDSSPFSTIIINPQVSDREKEQTFPSQVSSFLWGEVEGTAQVFERWVALVRKRSSKLKPSGFPHRLAKTESMPRGFFMEEKQSATELISGEPYAIADNSFPLNQAPEMSLWERLGNAATLNVESSAITWSCLSSLHHIEHTSSNEHSEDELNKALEVTVNSGGVVFFALFNNPEDCALLPKEAAAVIKITSSRLTTLSERLGYEFARLLGVQTPQARVVHNFSPEWQIIQDATENACNGAVSSGDEVGEMTCSELSKALEMSRCILMMNYVHGSPLLKNSQAFDSPEAAGNTATALGKILLLDLVIRNEDRLPCYQLGWRGNAENLLFVDKIAHTDFHIVAIDTGVPRRPPAGKRATDQERYPRLVELMLNSLEYSSNLLHEISGGKLGFSASEEADTLLPSSPTFYSLSYTDMIAAVNKFRGGFRDSLMDLQSIHLFLLTLHQKLDDLFRIFLPIVSRNSEDSTSYGSRGNWNDKYFEGSGEQSHRLRLTMKLRDFHKFVKVDVELNKELEQWIEMLRIEVVNFCQENNFNTGFFDGNDSNIVIDAYELKVRLEHILDRIALISDAMNTERPSQVTDYLFIGGALAARSLHTLRYLDITHILCLCLNEIGESDSQHPELFEYKNFLISDSDEEDISSLFVEACDFISTIARSGGKVLVHCSEGKSRSATVVLAYLMITKGLTLLESWNMLKKIHGRAQPNNGFAKALLELDMRLHGKVSMDWKHKKPVMKVCPICGKNVGLSTSSLKLHLQKFHKRKL